METIVCFGAHADDLEIGMGASIAKFKEEGKQVIGIIFTSGEKSSPWLKADTLKVNRREEAIKIGEFIGFHETIILDLQDGILLQEIQKKSTKKKIQDLIYHYRPIRIFCHSSLDPHKDHQAVNKSILEALSSIDPEKKIPVYVYEVWNLVNESGPRMYVNVSLTFGKKIEAMKKFKSQWLYVYLLIVPVFLRAFFTGIKNRSWYAERFYKLR